MRLDVVGWAEVAFVRGRRLRADPKCQNDLHWRYRDTWSVFERKLSHIGAGRIPVRVNKGRPGSQPNLPRCLKDLGLEPHV